MSLQTHQQMPATLHKQYCIWITCTYTLYTTFAWEFKGILPKILPEQYLAIFSQRNMRNTCNMHNKLPVAIFAAREMCVICAKYN